MSEQANLDVVLGIYEAFTRGDIAAILDRLDPQAELAYEGPSAIPWAGNRRGRDGWTSFFQAVGETLDDVSLQMEPFAAQGDHVVCAGRYQARVRRTGKRIDSPLVHLWTLRDGKILQCREMTDTGSEAAACTATAAAV